jgi:hypothetical protein
MVNFACVNPWITRDPGYKSNNKESKDSPHWDLNPSTNQIKRGSGNKERGQNKQ